MRAKYDFFVSSNSTRFFTTLKRKLFHFDKFFITGCIGSCQNDNFRCSQWRIFHQNDIATVQWNSIRIAKTNQCRTTTRSIKVWTVAIKGKVTWVPWPLKSRATRLFVARRDHPHKGQLMWKRFPCHEVIVHWQIMGVLCLFRLAFW